MNSTSLRLGLPELYRHIFPPFFDTAAPREEKATCSNCAMCAPPGTPPAASAAYFHPDAKCCTFHPKLPNYLVGGLLRDERADIAEGRRRMRQLIARRIGVTPGWVAPPRKTNLIYHASRSSSFGRSLVLRCPYFEEERGLCTIWRWRESDCSTFFCKYVAGAEGQHFWRTFSSYLWEVESRLSAHAAATVAPDLVEPQIEDGELTLEDLEDRAPEAETYAAWWRGFAGREEDFYIACAEVVAALEPAQFAEISGPVARERLAALETCHRRMVDPQLPEHLVLSPSIQVVPSESGVVVSTYCDYEPLALSTELYQVLQRFRAEETVAEIKTRLRQEDGTEIPDSLLITLHQMRVLIAPGVPDEAMAD